MVLFAHPISYNIIVRVNVRSCEYGQTISPVVPTHALSSFFFTFHIAFFTYFLSHKRFNSKGGESKSSEPVTSTPAGSGSASSYVMPSADNTRIRSIKVNSSGTMVALLTGEFDFVFCVSFG